MSYDETKEMIYLVIFFISNLFNKGLRIPKGPSKYGQFGEPGIIGHRRRRKTKLKQSTICVGLHYMQTNTNSVNKTWSLLRTTIGKNEQNIVFMRISERKDT